MEGLIQSAQELFQKGDVLETLILYFSEHYELLIAIAAAIFIMVLSLSVILQRLQKSSLIALVPVYRFLVIFKAIGIKSWCIILFLIPGVNLIARVYFYAVLVRKFKRDYGFVPFLVMFPLIFLPIIAFGEGRHARIDRGKRESKQRRLEREQEKQAKRGGKNVKPAKQAQKKAQPATKEPTDEEILRVLSMAEVRANRAQARAEKEQAKAAREVRVVREVRVPQAQPVAPKVIRPVQTKDMMPSMRQGAMAQRARIEREGAYARLLRQQEEEQRLRTQRRQRMVPNRSVVVEKPVAKAAPARPGGRKRIDF